MRFCCLMVLLLACGTAGKAAPRRSLPSPELQGLFIENVSRMLLKYGLLDELEIHGLSPNNEEVVGRVGYNVDLRTILRNNAAFTPDMFHSGWSHEGCQWSFRSKSSPSLQITYFPDHHVEMDIDRWCPRWLHPIATVKHLYEISEHRVVQWFHRSLTTSQRAIAKALNKQKYPVLVPKQARVFFYLLFYG